MKLTMQYDIRRNTPSDIWEHLPFMHEAAMAYPAPKIVELGTRTGNSTAALLAAIERRGEGHMWSVDVDDPRVPDAWRALDYWTMIVGDDTDPAVVSRVKDESQGCDVLFIDTSHFYQHTMDELALYVPLVTPGGIVMMHDTEWMGREVEKALNEFCPEHGLTWENRPGCNGLGVIRVGG